MNAFSPCLLIPCYNHGAMIANVVNTLRAFTLPIIIVDDGSDATTKQVLTQLDSADDITLIALPQNQGKGAAMILGFEKAHALGYSHAIQVDADGQHDLSAMSALLAASQAASQALISGRPVYDNSVPKSRLYGRYITHFWVRIETLSSAIKDAMCGFRSYPLAQTLPLIQLSSLGKRMDFDIDIMVRFYWEGHQVSFVDIPVTYPPDGLSHFDVIGDNIRITKMHCQLFFGMLPRIPSLLARRNSP